MMPPTPEAQPLEQTPQPATTPGDNGFLSGIIPKANASESQPNIIQQYLDDPKQDMASKQEIMKAINNGDEDSIMKSLQDGGYK